MTNTEIDESRYGSYGHFGYFFPRNTKQVYYTQEELLVNARGVVEINGEKVKVDNTDHRGDDIQDAMGGDLLHANEILFPLNGR